MASVQQQMADIQQQMADIQKRSTLNDPIPSSDNVGAVPSYKEKDPLAPHTEKDPLAIKTEPKSTTTSTTGNSMLANVSNTVTDGPVAQNVKAAYGNTVADFSSLNDSKVVPDAKAATGQPLTTYHSFFYNLLTWKKPRATAIMFVANIALIFMARYLPLSNWLFKSLALVFGTTVVAELAGKPFGSNGFTSAFRPKKYYVLPREAVDGFFSELHELLNFFVLEFQRILFVENIPLTATAAITAAVSWGLIKIVPLWGLTLIGTVTLYLVPLIYVQNKEFIDAHLRNASKVVETQAAQVQQVAAQQTSRAAEAARGYATDISSKTAELVGQARGSVSGASSPTNGTTKSTTNGTSTGSNKTAPSSGVKSTGASTGVPTSHAAPPVHASGISSSTTPATGLSSSTLSGSGLSSTAPASDIHAAGGAPPQVVKTTSLHTTGVPASGVYTTNASTANPTNGTFTK